MHFLRRSRKWINTSVYATLRSFQGRKNITICLTFSNDISHDIFPNMEHFTSVFEHDINMFFCYVRMHFYKLLAVITAEKRTKNENQRRL